MELNPIYISAGLLGLGLLIAVLSVSFSSGEPRGVAKSLQLIETTVAGLVIRIREWTLQDRKEGLPVAAER